MCGAISTADVVVVRAHEDTPLWRQCEERIAGGALVVFASARALHSGRCARSGMDVVLVTNIDEPRVGCRLAVHRDVSRRALLRAVAYARAVSSSRKLTLFVDDKNGDAVRQSASSLTYPTLLD